MLSVVLALLGLMPSASAANVQRSPYSLHAPVFEPCGPQSPFMTDSGDTSTLNSSAGSGEPVTGLDLNFCARHNPDFKYNGHRCCQKIVYKKKRRRGSRCGPSRQMKSFCGEVSVEQKIYGDSIRSGKVDVLAQITADLGRSSSQAQCSPNNGFLVNGRPVVPTSQNKISLRSPDRCTEFGTDGMIGMVEWLGREVAKQYSGLEYDGTKLVIGDVSPPRGGCTGHASHRSGQDVDIAFLWAKPGRDSPQNFHRDFDAKANWWFLKKVLKNPYACVKVIFLDRRLINKISRIAQGDEDWQLYRRFIRHMPHHRNHHHVRIGNFPGQPGCVADAMPELEEEQETSEDALNSEISEPDADEKEE